MRRAKDGDAHAPAGRRQLRAGHLHAEQCAGSVERQAIVDAIEGSDHVKRLIHVRTQHLGPDEILVAAKVEFDADLTFAELAAAINRSETKIRDAVPMARLIYLEPDVHTVVHTEQPPDE